jgi:hypothetical protein
MTDDLPQLPPHPWRAHDEGWTLRERQVIYAYGEACAKAAREQEREEIAAMLEPMRKESHGWNTFSYTCAIDDATTAIRARKP